MKSFLHLHKEKFFILLFIVWLFIYYINIVVVPFHPDEATQIFMSDDIDIFLKHPSDLFYSDTRINDPKQTYRLLDSPLTRYSIGVWRNIIGLEPLMKDWDWSLGWEENQNAYPSQQLLIIARLSVTWVFPCTVILIYKLTKKIFNQTTAILTVLFFLTNAIILLHTRRAMAESLLLFFLITSLWVLFSVKDKFLFLAAIPITLGINTKQSLIFLIPALFIVLLIRLKISLPFLKQAILSSGIILILTFLLNPVIWENPAQTIPIMLAERNQLLDSQVQTIQAVSPDFILNTPLEKLIGVIAQTLITPPAYQDVANYSEQLEPQITNYERNFVYQGLFRTFTIGIINLVLFVFSIFLIIKNKTSDKLLFLMIFIFAVVEIMLVFPIPFQRYYLPLYPFGLILISYCLSLLSQIKKTQDQS